MGGSRSSGSCRARHPLCRTTPRGETAKREACFKPEVASCPPPRINFTLWKRRFKAAISARLFRLCHDPPSPNTHTHDKDMGCISLFVEQDSPGSGCAHLI